MKSYGQFCPVAKAAEVFCERWTPLILRDLSSGIPAFPNCSEGIPLASPTLLSRRLKQLEAEGIIARNDPERAQLDLPPDRCGQGICAPIVLALGEWGQRWSRRNWQTMKSIWVFCCGRWSKGPNPTYLAIGGRSSASTCRSGRRAEVRWWFLNEEGKCELCLEAPVHDADLYVRRRCRHDLCLARRSAACVRPVQRSA